MVIHPYPFLVVITQLLPWIIFINDSIGILTGSPGYYFSLSYMLYEKSRVMKILQILLT